MARPTKSKTYSRLYIIAWLRSHHAYRLADFLDIPPKPRQTRTYTNKPVSDAARWHSALHNAPDVGRWCRNGTHWACSGVMGRGKDKSPCCCPVCKHPLGAAA